jgi:hypothetical protein
VDRVRFGVADGDGKKSHADFQLKEFLQRMVCLLGNEAFK